MNRDRDWKYVNAERWKDAVSDCLMTIKTRIPQLVMTNEDKVTISQ